MEMGQLKLYGSAPGLGSDWDDALPQPIDVIHLMITTEVCIKVISILKCIG